MLKVRVNAYAVSIDGYGAGPDQGLDNPLGRGGEDLHQWFFPTRTFQRMFGKDEGTTGTDEDFAARHCPVFVLTHYPRPPLEMKGGTVFHFVADPIEEILFRAKEAAGTRDVRIGGGAATIREYLAARLIDEMHLVVSPVVLGAGGSLLDGIDLRRLGYGVTEHVSSEKAMHAVLSKQR